MEINKDDLNITNDVTSGSSKMGNILSATNQESNNTPTNSNEESDNSANVSFEDNSDTAFKHLSRNDINLIIMGEKESETNLSVSSDTAKQSDEIPSNPPKKVKLKRAHLLAENVIFTNTPLVSTSPSSKIDEIHKKDDKLKTNEPETVPEEVKPQEDSISENVSPKKVKLKRYVPFSAQNVQFVTEIKKTTDTSKEIKISENEMKKNSVVDIKVSEDNNTKEKNNKVEISEELDNVEKQDIEKQQENDNISEGTRSNIGDDDGVENIKTIEETEILDNSADQFSDSKDDEGIENIQTNEIDQISDLKEDQDTENIKTIEETEILDNSGDQFSDSKDDEGIENIQTNEIDQISDLKEDQDTENIKAIEETEILDNSGDQFSDSKDDESVENIQTNEIDQISDLKEDQDTENIKTIEETEILDNSGDQFSDSKDDEGIENIKTAEETEIIDNNDLKDDGSVKNIKTIEAIEVLENDEQFSDLKDNEDIENIESTEKTEDLEKNDYTIDDNDFNESEKQEEENGATNEQIQESSFEDIDNEDIPSQEIDNDSLKKENILEDKIETEIQEIEMDSQNITADLPEENIIEKEDSEYLNENLSSENVSQDITEIEINSEKVNSTQTNEKNIEIDEDLLLDDTDDMQVENEPEDIDLDEDLLEFEKELINKEKNKEMATVEETLIIENTEKNLSQDLATESLPEEITNSELIEDKIDSDNFENEILKFKNTEKDLSQDLTTESLPEEITSSELIDDKIDSDNFENEILKFTNTEKDLSQEMTTESLPGEITSSELIEDKIDSDNFEDEILKFENTEKDLSQDLTTESLPGEITSSELIEDKIDSDSFENEILKFKNTEKNLSQDLRAESLPGEITSSELVDSDNFENEILTEDNKVKLDEENKDINELNEDESNKESELEEDGIFELKVNSNKTEIENKLKINDSYISASENNKNNENESFEFEKITDKTAELPIENVNEVEEKVDSKEHDKETNIQQLYEHVNEFIEDVEESNEILLKDDLISDENDFLTGDGQIENSQEFDTNLSENLEEAFENDNKDNFEMSPESDNVESYDIDETDIILEAAKLESQNIDELVNQSDFNEDRDENIVEDPLSIAKVNEDDDLLKDLINENIQTALKIEDVVVEECKVEKIPKLIIKSYEPEVPEKKTTLSVTAVLESTSDTKSSNVGIPKLIIKQTEKWSDFPEEPSIPKITIKSVNKLEDVLKEEKESIPKLTIKNVGKSLESEVVTGSNSPKKFEIKQALESEQIVPKITIMKSDVYDTKVASPKFSIKQHDSDSSEAIPKIKIKTLKQQDDVKSEIKQENISKNIFPKSLMKSSDFESNILLKQLSKPLSVDISEPSTSKPQELFKIKTLSPKITIKPIVKPDEERLLSFSQKVKSKDGPSSPKITIKPLIKPGTENASSLSPKLLKQAKIDKFVKNSDPLQGTNVNYDISPRPSSFSPKITIKPIVKPVENLDESEIKNDRIILKINKNEAVKSELMQDNKKDDKFGLKLLKESDNSDMYGQSSSSLKRLLNQETTLEAVTPKRAKMEMTGSALGIFERSDLSIKVVKNDSNMSIRKAQISDDVTIVRVTPQSQNFPTSSKDSVKSKLKQILTKLNQNTSITTVELDKDNTSTNDSDDVKIVGVSRPNEESQDVMIIDEVIHAETTPVVPVIRKRGRPRKVPLEVRPDLKDENTDSTENDITIVNVTHPDNLSEDGGSRPKRNCRGRTTPIVTKPRRGRGGASGVVRGERKAGRRGRGAGRGRRSMIPFISANTMNFSEVNVDDMKSSLREVTVSLGEKIDPTSHNIILPLSNTNSPAISLSAEDPLDTPIVIDLVDTPPPMSQKIETVFLEEETRMSAEVCQETEGIPQIARHKPPVDGTEESRSSSTTTESTKGKRGRMEVSDADSRVTGPDQIAEYAWNNGGPYMLQEQIAQYLGVKSFKRKYPGIARRTVDMQERDYLRDNGLASEALCDMGLTSVISSDILDIMVNDFPEKYEEYRKYQRDKQAKELSSKQRALRAASLERVRAETLAERAVREAASWNATLNKTRREERHCCMDLQTFTVMYPRGRKALLCKPKLGNFPVALVPGQFTDYYRDYTPTELKFLPINTVMYGPVIPNQIYESNLSEDSDSDTDSSSGSSDSDSSDSDSSLDEVLPPPVSTTELCKICVGNETKQIKTEEIINCAQCNSGIHPTCVEITPDMLQRVRAYAWQCTDCKTCWQCQEPSDDDKMLFCDRCDRGYHIYCVGLRKVPSGSWHCQQCT